MNLKILITVICCLFFCDRSFAQVLQNVFFLKKSGQAVKERDSADFIRIISEPDADSVLFNVTEFYKNGTKKLLGKSSRFEYVFLEGQCVTFFPSGIKKEIANYKRNIKNGDAYSFYPNGKLYTQVQYKRGEPYRPDEPYQPIELLLNCNDSTGKALTANGDGYYVGYDDEFKNVIEEGPVKAGLKDGKWKGENEKGKFKITFDEEYKNGLLIAGKSVDENNYVCNYSIRYKMPEYEGGLKAFGEYLEKKIKYPYNARMNKIQGKVIISFVVEKDGSLTDYKIIRNPDDELTAEALRVLKSSPAWTPGMQFGRLVRVVYSVPIVFAL